MVTLKMGIRKSRLQGVVWALLSLVYISNAAYNPPDNYLINCGSSSNTTISPRIFDADTPDSWSLSAPKTVFATSSSNSPPSSDDSPLYRTARIFQKPSTYSFPIKQQGRHFIRLYFFPFLFQTFDLASAKFSIATQDFTLLKDFQADKSPVMKEYLVNVTLENLVLSFLPSESSFAFVNAIEVVSTPNDMIRSGMQTLDPVSQYDGIEGIALETVYRVNMGGPRISSSNDSLWRNWFPDGKFIRNEKVADPVKFSGTINYLKDGATRETAPDAIYSTAMSLALANVSRANFNVSWDFPLDKSFTYFVRMHFCDIVSKTLNQLVFDVYVGGLVAARDLDLTSKTSTLAAAYYMDFVVDVNDEFGKLGVSIGPSPISEDQNAILNGLEIMKMSNSDRSLDVRGSTTGISHSNSKTNRSIILGSVFGSLGLIFLIIILLMVCKREKKMTKQHSKTWLPFSTNGGNSHTFGSKFSNGTITSSSGQNTNLGFAFSFAVLQDATNNFDENWVIGIGGFGKVYKGVLRDDTKVAVKRGNPKSQQGINEFRTEIDLLSRLRHRHLVSLIGYCDEGTEMILVYEYMEKGTLKSHLYGTDNPPLSWKQRLEICIGAARGLHYLHTGQAMAIIHRDVKSANILLDESLMAKVADFGLSKTGPELDQTHVSTAVKGSFGYLDPEYFRRQQLTDKSDVYSFGVVLFEVLCARPVIDPTLQREMVNLAEWALKWQKKGQLDQILDQKLAGAIRPESLRKFGETVEKCLADYGVDRPTMGDVLWNLEYALQLQEALNSTDPDSNSTTDIPGFSSQIQSLRSLELASVQGASGGRQGSSQDLTDVSMSKVFSQLVKAEGR